MAARSRTNPPAQPVPSPLIPTSIHPSYTSTAPALCVLQQQLRRPTGCPAATTHPPFTRGPSRMRGSPGTRSKSYVYLGRSLPSLRTDLGSGGTAGEWGKGRHSGRRSQLTTALPALQRRQCAGTACPPYTTGVRAASKQVCHTRGTHLRDASSTSGARRSRFLRGTASAAAVWAAVISSAICKGTGRWWSRPLSTGQN